MPILARPRTRSAVGCLLLCTAFFSGCDKLDLSSPADHIAKARTAIAAKDPRTAEVELKNALQKDGKNPEARLLLAESYLLMNRGQAAEVEISHAEQFGASPESTLLLRARAYVIQRQYNRVLKDLPAEFVGDPGYVADLDQVRGDAQTALGLLNEAEQSYDAVLKTRPDAIDSLYGKARVEARRGNLESASRLVDQGLAIDPKSTVGLLLKGDVLFSRQDDAGAMKAYTEAVEAAPNNEEARVALGGALIRAGKLDAADEQIATIFKRSPNSVQGNYLRAVVSFSRHQLKEAFEAVQKVTSAVPDFAPAVLLTAAIEYEQQSFLQAEANAQRYVQAFPGSIPARKLLAATLLKENKPSEAFAAIEPALSQPNLNDGQVYALAGAALTRSGKAAQAIEYLAKASALNPTDNRLKTAYGMGSLATGDTNRAIDTFESLVRVDTSNVDADSVLVISYIGRKEYSKAIAAAQALIDQHPKNPAFYNLLGGAYGASGDLAKARESFEQALSVDPSAAPAAMNLATMDLVDKKPDDARKHLTAVLSKDPKNIDVLNALADLEIGQAKYDAAAKWLETSVQQNPEVLRAKVRLIRFYLQNRDAQRALTLGREAEAKNPANVELLLLLAEAQAVSGDRNGAVSTYGRIAGLTPTSEAVQLQIASLEAADGHSGAARAALQKALAIAPNSVRASMALAELEIGLGRFDEARRVAAQLEKTPASLPQARLVTGNIAMAQRKYDAAAKAFGDAFATLKTPYLATRLHAALAMSGRKKEADEMITGFLSRNRGDVESRLYLAGAAQLSGDAPKTRDLYNQVIVIDPKNVIALNELALVAHAARDPQAVQFAERAYALKPDSGAISDTLGWILVDSGDVDRGQRMLEKAVKAAPWNSEARYHLALALVKSGDTAAAKSNLRQVIESQDEFAQRDEARKLLDRL